MKNIIKPIGTIAVAMLLLSGAAMADEVYELTIPDVIDISLKHNLKLQIERISPQISEQGIIAAESIFDPTLNVSGSISERKSAESDSDAASSQRRLETGIGKGYAYGTKVSLNISANDNADKTTAGDAYDSHNALTVLTVTQPLLKGRGFEANRRDITLAHHHYQHAVLDFQQLLINTIAETQKRYWILYSAIENLSVHEKSLLLAKKFLAEMEERVSIGSAAALDTLQAEAEVALREESVIVAENEALNHQDSLLNFIYGGLGKFGMVKCVQKPVFEVVDMDEDALFHSALKMRTDYLKARLKMESAETNLAYMRNRKLPQLDLNTALGYNWGGGDNSQSSTNQDYYTGSIGLSLEFPWGFRKDQANYHSARLSLTQSDVTIKEIESQLRLEVRSALRNLRSSNKRYQATAIAEQLAEEKLDAERVKYANGLSTSYNVLQYQRDLTDARVRRVGALIACQTGIIDLHRIVGITLEKNRILLQEASVIN